MPSKNTIRNFQPFSYYHIYNRGISKQSIFLDGEDYKVFLSLFDRYLNPTTTQVDSDRNRYECFSSDIELQNFCLMGNHYHLLIHVNENTKSLSQFMKVLSASYTSYVNKRYDRIGPLFQSRYKSSRIVNDEHLLHVSRYIHLNPEFPLTYEYSSIHSLLSEDSYLWLNCGRLKAAIGNLNYLDFLSHAVA